MYNPKSRNAEEFINNEEILSSISYAKENKNNLHLIDEILDKARTHKGISHREAALLLACEDKEKNEEIFKLAQETELYFLPLYIFQIIV